jgi:hypothetical protein
MTNQHFQYSFTSSKNANEVFAFLINPKNWWIGLFNETIEGKSVNINDDIFFQSRRMEYIIPIKN